MNERGLRGGSKRYKQQVFQKCTINVSTMWPIQHLCNANVRLMILPGGPEPQNLEYIYNHTINIQKYGKEFDMVGWQIHVFPEVKNGHLL